MSVSINSQLIFSGVLVNLVTGMGGAGTPLFTRTSSTVTAVIGATYFVEANLTAIARAVNNSSSQANYAATAHPYILPNLAGVTILSTSGYNYAAPAAVPENLGELMLTRTPTPISTENRLETCSD